MLCISHFVISLSKLTTVTYYIRSILYFPWHFKTFKLFHNVSRFQPAPGFTTSQFLCMYGTWGSHWPVFPSWCSWLTVFCWVESGMTVLKLTSYSFMHEIYIFSQNPCTLSQVRGLSSSVSFQRPLVLEPFSESFNHDSSSFCSTG